jgi:hypothetical protein
VWNTDNDVPTRFANAVPVLDGGHRVIQMLQNMGSVNVVKGIVSVFVHCGCIAIIFVMVNAIGQADGVHAIVGVNSAAADVNALTFDVKVVKSCCQSALVCFSCFSHFYLFRFSKKSTIFKVVFTITKLIAVATNNTLTHLRIIINISVIFE